MPGWIAIVAYSLSSTGPGGATAGAAVM